MNEQLNIDALGAKVENLGQKVEATSAAVCRLEKNTREMIEVFDSFKGAMKVLEMVGKMAKPLGAIVMFCAAVAGLWASVKGLWK